MDSACTARRPTPGQAKTVSTTNAPPSKVPNCNIELAVRGQVMITLGELAYRNNQTFTFDPKTRKATPETTKFPPA